MKPNSLEVKAAIQISKPVNEVFEAIVDPLQHGRLGQLPCLPQSLAGIWH
jgi:hypothetical protein